MTALLVSACVPLYKPRSDWLDAVLRSLKQQDYEPLEVVLRDDTPGHLAPEVAEVLDTWRSVFARLDYERNATRLGMVANWNASVRASKGDLAINVHQDDVIGAGMLRAMVHEIGRPGGPVACGVGVTYIDANGAELRWRPRMDRSRIFRREARYELGLREMVALNLRNGQAFGEPSAVMFERAGFDAVGGYDRLFEHAADVDFHLRLAAIGRVVYLPHPYLLRRMHSSNLTKTHVRSGATGRDRVRLFDRYALTSGLSTTEVERVRITIATRFLRDALRSFRLGEWRAGIGFVRSLRPFLRNHPVRYAAHLFELASGTNLDER